VHCPMPVETPIITATCAAPPMPAGRAIDAVSFDRAYEKYVDFVRRTILRLGVGEAASDDVVQQVFVVVHRRLAEFQGRSSLKTWLFSIVLHAVREHRRSVRRKSPHWLLGPTDPDLLPTVGASTNPHEALTKAQASRLIDGLLACLHEDKRVVFVMAELEEMTAAEISEVTGLDVKAVYSRLRAARIDFEREAARLRRRLAKEDRS
jgi:RNA polymerase sigma-70 factor (ECF subfamily)